MAKRRKPRSAAQKAASVRNLVKARQARSLSTRGRRGTGGFRVKPTRYWAVRTKGSPLQQARVISAGQTRYGAPIRRIGPRSARYDITTRRAKRR